MSSLENDINGLEKQKELLRLECVQHATVLTETIKKTEKTLLEFELKKKEIEDFCNSKKLQLIKDSQVLDEKRLEFINFVESENRSISEKKKELERSTKEESDKLLQLRNESVRQKEDALTELNKANELLQKVREEKYRLQLESEQILSDISVNKMVLSDLVELTTKKNELIKSIQDLSDEKLKTSSRLTNEVNTLTLSIANKSEELERLDTLLLKKKDEANQAEYRTKKYVDELYTHMNDYEVVKSRLETVWGKTFPELDLKM